MESLGYVCVCRGLHLCLCTDMQTQGSTPARVFVNSQADQAACLRFCNSFVETL